jgi:hypothetical protein
MPSAKSSTDTAARRAKVKATRSDALIGAKHTGRPIYALAGREALMLAMGQSLGVAIDKRGLSEGGAHPFPLPCLDTGEAMLYDVTRAWFRSFWAEGDIYRAFAWCQALIVWSGEPAYAKRAVRILDAMRPECFVVAVLGADAEGEGLKDRLSGRANVRFVEANLSTPKGVKAAFEALRAAVDRADSPPLAGPPLMVARKVTGYGIKAGVLKVSGYPILGELRAGDRVEVVTLEGPRVTTIEQTQTEGADVGVILALQGVRPESVFAVGAAGAARLLDETATFHATDEISDYGQLYALGQQLGIWRAQSGKLQQDDPTMKNVPAGDPRIWRRRVVDATASRTPFLFVPRDDEDDVRVGFFAK